MNSSPDTMPRLFWLWLPLLLLVVQIALEVMLPSETLATMLSENGPHESLQAVIMSGAFVVAIMTLYALRKDERLWLKAWAGIAALASLYVAGEEMSWGQHLLDWSTPEFWMAVNDQGETNLHNTSSWLDQKPRLILLLGVTFGGIVFPLLLRFKPGFLPQRFLIIYPPAVLSVTAALAVSMNLQSKVDDVLEDITFFERPSEIEELYLFYFVLLYLVVLRRRILQNQS